MLKEPSNVLLFFKKHNIKRHRMQNNANENARAKTTQRGGSFLLLFAEEELRVLLLNTEHYKVIIHHELTVQILHPTLADYYRTISG